MERSTWKAEIRLRHRVYLVLPSFIVLFFVLFCLRTRRLPIQRLGQRGRRRTGGRRAVVDHPGPVGRHTAPQLPADPGSHFLIFSFFISFSFSFFFFLGWGRGKSDHPVLWFPFLFGFGTERFLTGFALIEFHFDLICFN